MKREYQLLHQAMLRDIERCWRLQLPEKDRVESCFWIANSYWDKLKELMRLRVFNGESEEIEFFRDVKPQC